MCGNLVCSTLSSVVVAHATPIRAQTGVFNTIFTKYCVLDLVLVKLRTKSWTRPRCIFLMCYYHTSNSSEALGGPEMDGRGGCCSANFGRGDFC